MQEEKRRNGTEGTTTVKTPNATESETLEDATKEEDEEEEAPPATAKMVGEDGEDAMAAFSPVPAVPTEEEVKIPPVKTEKAAAEEEEEDGKKKNGTADGK